MVNVRNSVNGFARLESLETDAEVVVGTLIERRLHRRRTTDDGGGLSGSREGGGGDRERDTKLE